MEILKKTSGARDAPYSLPWLTMMIQHVKLYPERGGFLGRYPKRQFCIGTGGRLEHDKTLKWMT